MFLKQCLKPSPIIEIAPGRKIGGNFPCFIIAEIGQNHQGDIEIAKKLIQIAVVSYLHFYKYFKILLNVQNFFNFLNFDKDTLIK